MNKTVRPVWAEVDLQAIRDNLSAIKSRLDPSTQLMAVVKANAYGHGLVEVAKAALGGPASWLGVAIAEEGFELRRAGIEAPILILSEAPPEAAAAVVADNLTPTIYTRAAADALSQAAVAAGAEVPVHIKIDTGMHRVGVAPENTVELYKYASDRPGLEVAGMLTHFACADNPDNQYTARQLDIFLHLRELLPLVPLWHAANSAAALFMPQTRLDMVRVGIAMYGLEPSSAPSPVALQPALSLKTRIAFVQQLEPGQGVSYGLTYTAKKKVRVATIPIGYGDGFSRLLSNKGRVLVGGRPARLVGNICMDQALIELPGPGPDVSDEVVLIGPQGEERVTAEEVAAVIGTINYEVVCMINARVPRVYLNQ